ncbi:hypothetical protein GCM10010168_19500 [Actinoplanes ianthinogenes]|uniref:Uncharacterized protein n=1 Tax=Actinoplanes ianthinogenes TaxID=122358 RepID=A0ABM7M7K1_9ACTN|nr:hypothetical protein Aiant_82490 [Actinoplanes ianthinogenes]GGR02811.1 hypothetical protein GCM10010168_19500 [Actinoplanes ianthinogenes]
MGEIERLARLWLSDYLHDHKLVVAENGDVVPAPATLSDDAPVPPAGRPDLARILTNDLASLRARFEAFYALDPLDSTVIIGKLGGIPTGPADGAFPGVVRSKGLATSVYDRIGEAYETGVVPVRDLVDWQHWTGDGALAFRDRFLKPLQTASQQQQAYAMILAMVAVAQHAAIVETHHYLLNIADTLIRRLQGHGRTTEHPATVEFLSRASIAFGIASLIPGPGSLLTGALSLGTSLAGYHLGKLEENPDEAPIDGTAAPRAIESAIAVIDAVERRLSEFDDDLAGRLDGMDSANGFASPDLRVERPDVANSSDAMETLDFDKGAPTGDAVVVSVAHLYEAGYVHLPGAASQYEAAEAKLTSCELSHGVRAYLGRSSFRFEMACIDLAAILRSTRHSLADSGVSLVRCAQQYQLTDEQSADLLRRVENLVPPAADPDPNYRNGPV